MSRKKGKHKRVAFINSKKNSKFASNHYSEALRSLTAPRVEKLFSRFGRCRILVVGDLMLDRYLWGSVSRISPEAPVPIVEVNKEEHLLGGAANVASNIAALGGTPELIGVVGRDSFAGVLRKELGARGFSTQGVISDGSRPTTVKTRIMAHSQQVVRADREKTEEISERQSNRLLEYIEKKIKSASAVIISDYGKGVINARLLDYLIAACNRRDIFVAVDPKEIHFLEYRRVSTITPNHHEAGFATGKKIIDEASLVESGWQILDQLEAKSVLITLGERGMALFESGESPGENRSLTKIPTMARKVFDVTGAGDTVIAALTMAAAAGASLKEAAFIANVAAGEVVAEVGTAQVQRDKLKKLLLGHIRKNNLSSLGQ